MGKNYRSVVKMYSASCIKKNFGNTIMISTFLNIGH